MGYMASSWRLGWVVWEEACHNQPTKTHITQTDFTTILSQNTSQLSPSYHTWYKQLLPPPYPTSITIRQPHYSLNNRLLPSVHHISHSQPSPPVHHITHNIDSSHYQCTKSHITQTDVSTSPTNQTAGCPYQLTTSHWQLLPQVHHITCHSCHHQFTN